MRHPVATLDVRQGVIALEHRRLAYVGCGLAATLPPLGVDVGTLGALLWFLAHDTARMRGQTLSAEEAFAVLGAAGPELAMAVLGGSGLKWVFLPLGMGVGSFLNMLAAQNVVRATHLYLDSGRRLRGNALRTELEEARAQGRARRVR